MGGRVANKRRRIAWPALGLAIAFWGCYYAGFFAYQAEGGGTDAALGEEHQVNYPAHDTFVLTQDALHGEGVLFDVQPEDSLITLWQKADVPVGIFGSIFGVEPRYRYEIQVVPESANRSKVVVNVRAEDIPDDQLPKYKASARLDLFNKLDQLIAAAPPPSNLPRSGGVNFALLPNEDLKGLALRVTGDADNWKQIAHDNGISSPTDVSALQTIWVRNSLLKNVAPPAPGSGSAPK
jgi:hypothetical protein